MNININIQITRPLTVIAISALLYFGSFVNSNSAYAEHNSTLLLRSMIEEKSQLIIREIHDPRAVVFIEADARVALDSPLPGTPFVVGELAIREAAPTFARIRVNIISSRSALSPQSEQIVSKLLSQYALDVTFNYTSYSPPVLTEPETEASSSKDFSKEISETLQSVAALLEDGKEYFSLDNPGIRQALLLALSAIFIAALLWSFITSIFLYFVTRRSARILERGLSESISTSSAALSGSLSDSSGGGHFSEIGGKMETSPSAKREMDSGSINSYIKVIEEIGNEGLKALLFDYYWSSEDEKAAAFWLLIPLQRRKEMIASDKLLARYATYIAMLGGDHVVAPDLLNMYYSEPLNVNHLSNDDLVDIVRKEGGYYSLLSPVRKEALQISAVEKIRLSLAEHPESPSLAGLEQAPPSTPRKLKTILSVDLRSVEEEDEVLENSAIMDIDAKEGVKTLGWLMELKEEDVKEILASYSAKALAGVWVGPEKLLEELERFLPEDKRVLLKSYLDRSTPSRKGRVYAELHSKAIKALRSYESAVPQ